jgi:hypothetical protein
LFFVEQNGKQNGGVKIGNHSLKSVCPNFFVNRPKIYSFLRLCRQF